MKFKITAAKTAGFCFGVDRAVRIVQEALAAGKHAATLGPIVHNDRVVSELNEQGARIIQEPGELKPDETLIIRAHGVPQSVMDEANKTGAEVIDATCPFVARIHRIAAEQTAKGAHVLIAGDPAHPEVQGIVGHCTGNCTVFQNAEELKCLIKQKSGQSIAIAAQTTYNRLCWGECMALLPDDAPDLQVFDTICSATAERQADADALSRESDLMIVVGGKHSSNTVKLYDVCRRNCLAWHIAGAEDLAKTGSVYGEILQELRRLERIGGKNGETLQIGITAGASTPAQTIKEVQICMSDIIDTETIGTPENEDFDFATELEKGWARKLRKGERVTGTVAAINGNNEVMVDVVGAKQTGYITLSELTSDTSKKPSDIVNIGDELELVVIQVNDAEGTAQLSKKRVDEIIGFENIQKACESEELLEGTVMRVVKGGLVVDSNGVNIFIPASQSGLGRSEDLSQLVRQTVRFVVIEVNKERRRAVGSIRKGQQAERAAAKEKFWETAKVGDVYVGEVKSLTSFGAFVDLGGIDGMVHVSELSWSRIRQPSDVVSVGETLEVYIKALDKETGRISLGHKRAEDNPWNKFASEYSVGDVVEATIVSVTKFGAFARIVDNIDGLIHISQLANERVTNVADVVNIGDVVTVKITAIDTDKKRISLSIRAAEGEQASHAPAEEESEVVYVADDSAAEEPADAE